MLSAIAYPGIVLMLAARVAELRYVMPAAYVLVMFSAFGLNELWESRKNGLRIISALVLTYALGTGLAKGANMTYRMINDSRYAAGDWLADHTNPGDVIATFGPAANQPPLSPAITTIQAVPFTGLDPGFNVGDAEVRENLNFWAQEQPDFIIVMPDYTSLPGVPYSGTCHPRLCEGLIDGTLRGFRQVAFFESAELIPFLQRPTSSVRKREPTVIVSPPIRIFEMDPLAATESYVSAQDVSGQPARWE
jgi:hypothetical protein